VSSKTKAAIAGIFLSVATFGGIRAATAGPPTLIVPIKVNGQTVATICIRAALSNPCAPIELK
jgi:hypothetical protein